MKRWRGSLGVLLVSSLVLAGSLGCAVSNNEKEGGKKAARRPAEHDTLRTRNGDLLQGQLKLDSIELTTPYLPKLVLTRKDLATIEFEGDRDIVRTRHGDVLRGKLSVDRFRFVPRFDTELALERTDIRRIDLRE